VSVSAWAGSLLVIVLVVALYGHRAYGRFLAQHETARSGLCLYQLVEAAKPEPAAFGELLEFIRETLNAAELRCSSGSMTTTRNPHRCRRCCGSTPTKCGLEPGTDRRDACGRPYSPMGRARLVSNRRGT